VSTAPPAKRLGWYARRWSHLAITAALVAGLYLLWLWATETERVKSVVLPTPQAVWESTFDVVQQSSFSKHLWTSASELLLGFAIGVVSAVIMALLCDRYPRLRRTLTPYIVALQALPKIVLLPLLFVWFEVGFRATTVLVVLVVFFPVYLNALTGLASADEDGERLLVSLGATPGQRLRFHRIPSALPLLFTGCKTAVNFAFAAVLSAELLGSRYGLGFLIANSGNFLRIDDLYATVVVTTLFASALYLVVEIIDRKAIFWRHKRPRR